MARKIQVNEDGVPIRWRNRLAVDTDLQYVLIVLIGVVGPLVAVILYAILK